jgi:hypothetical protein
MAEKPDTIPVPIADGTLDTQSSSDGAETDAVALFSQTVADLSNGSSLDPAALGIVVPASSGNDVRYMENIFSHPFLIDHTGKFARDARQNGKY